MRLISQLIKGISKVIQKLFIKYFNGTAILAFFVFQAAGFPVISVLYLNVSDCVIDNLNHLCNIAINFQMFPNNHHYTQLNYTLALQHWHWNYYNLHYLFECYLFHLCSQLMAHYFQILLLYLLHLIVLLHHHFLPQ